MNVSHETLCYITPEQYQIGTLLSIPLQKRNRGNPSTSKKRLYKDVVATFDIETSRLSDVEQSIMYVWMLHLHGYCTIVGRTWEELNSLLMQMSSELDKDGSTLCIYVHNLSYEFQFLHAINRFESEDVFAIERRKVLKADMAKYHIELRCSYLHSNMALAEYTKKMGVAHVKQSGEEYDYSKERYPWTELTAEEIRYCIHDVVGLAEALTAEMEADGDNLYSIPLTSTGYVRRDAKAAMDTVRKDYVTKQAPTFEVYEMLREAFRGGNTHANRYYSGRIIKDVKSADRSSSYPDVVCNCLFPVTGFQISTQCSTERLLTLINVRKRAVVFRVAFSGLGLNDPFWGCPYLSRDKCRRIVNGVYDNGRILSADYLETTITDVDFKIILSEYSFDDCCPIKIAYAKYGKLPEPLIKTTIDYYRAKTELKGVSGQEVYYMKAKNKLNSIYGMMAQDPVKQSINFLPDTKGWEISKEQTPEELLNAHNQRGFLVYQWGVWVTAWARYRLEEGIRLAGDGFVYCDTDSVKYTGDLNLEEYNAQRRKDSTESGAFATDSGGSMHYMGEYEDDGRYNEFITLGAKKYAYNEIPGGPSTITVAGVNKKKGGSELDRAGGLPEFKPGFVFVEAGGTESIYNDTPEVRAVERDGRELYITTNVVIKDSTYTLGVTAEYANLINICAETLDNLLNL